MYVCQLLGVDMNSNRYLMELVDPHLVTNPYVPLVTRLTAFDTATIPLIGNAIEQAAG